MVIDKFLITFEYTKKQKVMKKLKENSMRLIKDVIEQAILSAGFYSGKTSGTSGDLEFNVWDGTEFSGKVVISNNIDNDDEIRFIIKDNSMKLIFICKNDGEIIFNVAKSAIRTFFFSVFN